MNASLGRRLGWLLIAIVVLLGVGGAAYWLGASNSGRGPGPFMMRPYGGWFGFNGMGGIDGFGLLWAVVIGFLFVLLIGALLAPAGPGRHPAADSADLDRLKDLAEMHDRGALNDEEYTAAKRKLLGL